MVQGSTSLFSWTYCVYFVYGKPHCMISLLPRSLNVQQNVWCMIFVLQLSLLYARRYDMHSAVLLEGFVMGNKATLSSQSPIPTCSCYMSSWPKGMFHMVREFIKEPVMTKKEWLKRVERAFRRSRLRKTETKAKRSMAFVWKKICVLERGPSWE